MKSRARVRWLAPTSFAPRLTDIHIETLTQTGIRGIIIDLDNTLVGYRENEPGAEARAWIAAAAAAGIHVVMVTNNRRSWARDVARGLGIAIIPSARKPLPGGFRRALKMLELPKSAIVVIGDQLFTDVLGARLFGVSVILTEPIVVREERWMRVIRRLERLFLRPPDYLDPKA